MIPLHYRAFHFGVFTYLKPNALIFQHILKLSIQNFIPLSIRTQIGQLRRGLEYFGSLEIDRNAEDTMVPVLDFSRT
jgi:hypothetical protein